MLREIEGTYKSDDAEKYAAGSWENNTYVNSYFGIEFELPSGWQKADKTENENLYQVDGNVLENEGDVITEAAALNADHASNIIFSVAVYREDDWKETMRKEFIQMKEVARNKVEEACDNYNISPKIDVEQGELIDIDMGKGQWMAGDIVTSAAPEGAQEPTLVITQRLYVGKRGDKCMLIVLTAMDDEMVQCVKNAFR